MTLHTRMIEVAVELDARAGAPLARWLSRPRRPLPAAPRDVLLVRLWGVGNLALLAPALDAARGGPRLRLLTLRANAPFVAAHFPHVEVLGVPAPHAPGFAPAAWRIARAVRADPPDVVVDLEQVLKLPRVLLRVACDAPIVGLAGETREPLLDHAVPADATRHTAAAFAAACRAAGLDPGRGPGGLRVAAAARAQVRRLLPRDDRPLVVVHPGSGAHAPGRRWPPARFGAVAARLAAHAHVVVTGCRRERRLVANVLAAAAPAAPADLSGRLDAAGWAALLAEADLLLTNDTGPLHVADAVGTPSVALFGPNTPLRYGPRTPGSVALYADLPCSPCLEARSLKRAGCRTFACMERLGVDAVTRACLAALARAGARAR